MMFFGRKLGEGVGDQLGRVFFAGADRAGGFVVRS